MLSLTLKCWYKNDRILKTVHDFSLWKEKVSNQRFCYAVLLWNMYHEGNENFNRIILAVHCHLNKKIYKVMEKVLHEIFGSGQQENMERSNALCIMLE